MNNLSPNIITVLFQVWKMQTGNDMVIDTEDGNIYEITEVLGEGAYRLLPLTGENNSPISHFSRSRLLFASDLRISENIGKYRDIIGSISDQYRATPRIEIGMASEQNRNAIGTESERHRTESEAVRALIGMGKVDLQPFSHLYFGTIAAIAESIEKVAEQIFSATNKKQTLKVTKDDYLKAMNMAKKGDLFELTSIMERLHGRRASQKTMVTNAETYARKLRRRRRLIIGTIIFTIISVGAFVAYSHFNAKYNINPPTPKQIDSAMNAYQMQSGIKIWPWRRDSVQAIYRGNTDLQLNDLQTVISF